MLKTFTNFVSNVYRFFKGVISRFFEYFGIRGRHEVISFLQNTIGGYFVLIPLEYADVVEPIVNGQWSWVTIAPFLMASAATLFKSACFALTGKKAFIRTPDAER